MTKDADKFEVMVDGDEVTIDLWRKGYGFHPEYDDGGGAAAGMRGGTGMRGAVVPPGGAGVGASATPSEGATAPSSTGSWGSPSRPSGSVCSS